MKHLVWEEEERGKKRKEEVRRGKKRREENKDDPRIIKNCSKNNENQK